MTLTCAFLTLFFWPVFALELRLQDLTVAPGKSVQDEIAKLQDLADQFTRKLELERRKVEELDKQIEMCEAKSMEQRRCMGGVNAAKENNQQVRVPNPKP